MTNSNSNDRLDRDLHLAQKKSLYSQAVVSQSREVGS